MRSDVKPPGRDGDPPPSADIGDWFQSESEHAAGSPQPALGADDRSIAHDRPWPAWDHTQVNWSPQGSLDEFLPESSPSTVSAPAPRAVTDAELLARPNTDKAIAIVAPTPVKARPALVTADVRSLPAPPSPRRAPVMMFVAAAVVMFTLAGVLGVRWARSVDEARVIATPSAAESSVTPRSLAADAGPVPVAAGAAAVPEPTAAGAAALPKPTTADTPPVSTTIAPSASTPPTQSQPVAPTPPVAATPAPIQQANALARGGVPPRGELPLGAGNTSNRANSARETARAELPADRSRSATAAPLVAAPIVDRTFDRGSAVTPPVRLPESPATTPAAAPASAPAAATTPPPIASAPVVTMPPPVERPKPPAPEAAPAATSVAVDQEDIQRVLGRYRSAFNDLNPAAAQTVWPSVNARALERAFDSLAEQGIEFNDCRITVTGVRATAACAGSTRYVTKVGNRQPRTEPRRWTFNLRKTDRQWLIDAVEAR